MRRPLSIVLLVLGALPLQAATRYFTERQGAPVHWEEWGSGALARARKEQRPIFLNVGYAASNECYRMHRQAFLNGEIAELMNAYFVPIIVDRIEYPEIAEATETILEAMGVEPGYPANLILTPDLLPVAAAGYLEPAELNRMLVINSNRWAAERGAIAEEGKSHLAKARELGERRMPSDVDPTSMDAVLEAIGKTYDAKMGAFGAPPLRPHPMTLSFLLRDAARTKNEAMRALAIDALRRIAASPLRDQLGGGFFRAAHDADWSRPHFEKMLPDQALMAVAYLEASQIAGDPELAYVARTTLDYVIRDLRPPRGPFDAAQDAHSLVPGQGPEFVNAAFYLWDEDEIKRLIGQETASKVFQLYGMKEGARNLPALGDPRFLPETHDELADPLAKMLDVRQKRPEPFRESTTIAGWNGLMISALARGASVLHEQSYLDAATAAATVVTAKLWNAKTKTLSRCEGVGALAEDYAMLIEGLLDLFDAGYDPRWLDLAIALQEREDKLFWDASSGAYTTGTSLPDAFRGLLVESEGETPAVNSISALNLLRLAALTGNPTWRVRPTTIFQAFGGHLRNDGPQIPALAAAYETSLLPPTIVVVTGDARKKETVDLLASQHDGWDPMRAVVFLPSKGIGRERMTRFLPFLGALKADPDHPVVYVCAQGQCLRR